MLRRGGNGEGEEEEEEEEEDRSSCCWVLEQASPCQIIWYLKLFDRCSESSLPSARRRRDRATVFYLRRREEIKRRCADSLVQKHNPDQPTLHTSTSDSVHVRTHTHTHTHTLSCASARTAPALVHGRFTHATTRADVGLCVGTVWLNLRQIQERVACPLPPPTSLFLSLCRCRWR